MLKQISFSVLALTLAVAACSKPPAPKQITYLAVQVSNENDKAEVKLLLERLESTSDTQILVEQMVGSGLEVLYIDQMRSTPSLDYAARTLQIKPSNPESELKALERISHLGSTTKNEAFIVSSGTCDKATLSRMYSELRSISENMSVYFAGVSLENQSCMKPLLTTSSKQVHFLTKEVTALEIKN